MNGEKEELIKARLNKLQEEAPDLKLMKMGVNATFTPEEALEEVEKGTKIGDAIKKSEEAMLDYVLEMEKEAL